MAERENKRSIFDSVSPDFELTIAKKIKDSPESVMENTGAKMEKNIELVARESE